MGYRSEVAAVISKETFDLYNTKVMEEKVENALNWADDIWKAEDDNLDTYYLIKWSWIKWYDEEPGAYRSVSLFMEVMRESERYKFLRMGEESGDDQCDIGSDWEWNCPFEVETERQIYTRVPGDAEKAEDDIPEVDDE